MTAIDHSVPSSAGPARPRVDHAPAAERRGVRRAVRAELPPALYERVERHLMDVRKPAQYVGREFNEQVGDWQAARTRWALCYPDTYEVGQPNQGIQILYEVLNERPTTLADRAYAPWMDLEERMRADDIPAFTLERHAPLWAYDVFAVSLPHELGHTNLLNLCDLGGIPVHAADRTDDHPYVLVGGHASYNPEPLAPFIDAAVMGDGEEVVGEFDAVVERSKLEGWDRPTTLRALADVEGVYVPSLYTPSYHDDGRLRVTVPVAGSGAPRVVPKRTVQDLEEWQYPRKQIVPMTEVVHERFSVEIFRGCTRGCRFCQAGMITRPVRERKPETVRRMVTEGVADTGFEEVGLLSLSSADHSGIATIARELADDYEGTVTSLSLPSTRVDAFNVTLSNELARNGRRTGLTFAPEAGSERMRAVINKMVDEDDMLRTAEIAFANGWRHVKLYFMVGLPTERDEDVLAIAELGIKVFEIARRHGKRNKVTVSVGGFVPKPHTPFQWCAQDSADEVNRKLRLIREAIKQHHGLTLRTNAPDDGVIEGLLARGDRRVAAAVERAWQLGARFDGWHETDTLPLWQQAMRDVGLDMDWFVSRDRELPEALPWDHLDSGLTKEWLWEDWEDARSEKELDDCRWTPCYDCGVCPGLSIFHDTGHDDQGGAADATPGTSLPVLPTAPAQPLGGDASLPTTAARLS